MPRVDPSEIFRFRVRCSVFAWEFRHLTGFDEEPGLDLTITRLFNQEINTEPFLIGWLHDTNDLMDFAKNRSFCHPEQFPRETFLAIRTGLDRLHRRLVRVVEETDFHNDSDLNRFIHKRVGRKLTLVFNNFKTEFGSLLDAIETTLFRVIPESDTDDVELVDVPDLEPIAIQSDL